MPQSGRLRGAVINARWSTLKFVIFSLECYIFNWSYKTEFSEGYQSVCPVKNRTSRFLYIHLFLVCPKLWTTKLKTFISCYTKKILTWGSSCLLTLLTFVIVDNCNKVNTILACPDHMSYKPGLTYLWQYICDSSQYLYVITVQL